jgi:hypothetical protein
MEVGGVLAFIVIAVRDNNVIRMMHTIQHYHNYGCLVSPSVNSVIVTLSQSSLPTYAVNCRWDRWDLLEPINSSIYS